MADADGVERYVVVRNDDEQYAIWPHDRPVVAGWHTVGVSGSHQECADHVDRVWTDLRPRSLRRHHDAPGGADRRPAGAAPTVCRLFEEQVQRRPDAPAVRTAHRTWTYAEFGALTAGLARRIIAAGARRDVVGLLADRSPAALTGIVAIMRAGAACLPLDPSDPPERNREVLAEAAAELVLVAAPTADLPRTMLIDGSPDTETAAARLPEPDPLDLAYAITTSGSSGRPKVVGVPHEGIANLVEASVRELDLIRPDDVSLWTTAVTVDSTMHDVLMPLCCGACVAIADGSELPASHMLAATRALSVTTLEVPAAVLGPYGRSLLPRLADAGVRLVITGGSQLDGGGIPALEGLVVHNGYGPTEASVAATWRRCVAPVPRRAPIGRPITGVTIHVLDEHLDRVPPGVEGHLHIGGVGLARGYLGQPGRTASAFLPDPYSDRAGQRMYATGDRVREEPDGEFVYLGRIDDQVKINGFRVESGEVEHHLRYHPAVLDAAVVVREDLPGGPALVAFLVGQEVADLSIVAHLRDRLPGHMVPHTYAWLSAMPLNRPGKIDRKALAALPLQFRPRHRSRGEQQ